MNLHVCRLAVAGVFMFASLPALATPVTLNAVAQPGGAVLSEPVEWQVTRLDKTGAPSGAPVAVGSTATLQTDLKPGQYMVVATRGTTSVKQGLMIGSSTELRNIVVGPANAAVNPVPEAPKAAAAPVAVPAAGSAKSTPAATQTASLPPPVVTGTAKLTIGMIPNSGRKAITDPIKWQVYTYSKGVTENGHLVADKTASSASFTLPAGSYVVRAAYKGTQSDLVIPLEVGQSYTYTINLYAGQAKLNAVKPTGPAREPVAWQIVREKPDDNGSYQLVTAVLEASPQLLIREGKYLVIARVGDLWGVQPLSVTAGRVTTAKVKLQRAEGAPVVVASAD